VNPNQEPDVDAMQDLLARDPRVDQLGPGDDRVLPTGDPGDDLFNSADKVPH
jgi:hypothetical protein